MLLAFLNPWATISSHPQSRAHQQHQKHDDQGTCCEGCTAYTCWNLIRPSPFMADQRNCAPSGTKESRVDLGAFSNSEAASEKRGIKADGDGEEEPLTVKLPELNWELLWIFTWFFDWNYEEWDEFFVSPAFSNLQRRNKTTVISKYLKAYQWITFDKMINTCYAMLNCARPRFLLENTLKCIGHHRPVSSQARMFLELSNSRLIGI